MAFVKTYKNFVTAFLVFIPAWIITMGIAGIIFTLSEQPEYITRDFVGSMVNFIPYKMLILYINWWIANPTIPLDAYNFLVVRLLLSILIPNILFFILIVRFRRKFHAMRPYKDKEKVHGNARWATSADIKKANLRSKKGLILGKDEDGLLVSPGYQHALLFAPTGSGKGVGFVVPNMLFWDESMLVNDIKLENYDLGSGYRKKMGQKVFIWNPANPDGFTHCYNPLDFISHKAGQMVDDTQKIVKLLMPKQDFWVNEARSFLCGLILYLIADPNKQQSFGEVVRLLRSDDVVYNLAVVLDTMGDIIHPVAYMNIAAFLQKADKERSGVTSTANSELELWVNPLIDTATATSDFAISDFKKEATTVFVGVTPDNIKRLQPLLQVFYQQATETLCHKLPAADEPLGVLFIMDEFPSLGKMEQFMIGIAYFRGYHVRLFLIVQDTEQLKGTYEQSGMNSFLSNSTYRITFAANNVETAELISKLCGNKTVEQISQSKPKFLDFNPAARTQSVSETQRALLLPQEVIGLPRDEQILLIEASPPIKTKKIKYYEDPFFKKRLFPPLPTPQQEPYDPKKKAKPVATEEGGDEEGGGVEAAENSTTQPESIPGNEEVSADGSDAGSDANTEEVFVGETEVISGDEEDKS
jgi:type IV secretion system protein VirD4